MIPYLVASLLPISYLLIAFIFKEPYYRMELGRRIDIICQIITLVGTCILGYFILVAYFANKYKVGLKPTMDIVEVSVGEHFDQNWIMDEAGIM